MMEDDAIARDAWEPAALIWSMTNVLSKHGGARVHFPPPLVFLGLIVLGLALDFWLGPLMSAFPPWLRWLGAGIALAGAVLLLSARVWFLRTGQHPAPWKPSPELLTIGIYRYTRNPMYLGLTLFQVGLGTAVRSGWMVALAPLGLLAVHFIAVRPEETYLMDKFGESYKRYVTSVRRYL
jgi:protein-S-isoprenylcysteine O-methyltransferase Ste14